MTIQAQTNPVGSARELDEIADEIATLSALIQAATYRLLCLIFEMDRRGGWGPLGNGFRSCAHWLAYRVGLSLGAAREQVRVARALPELPRISEAFSTGELSYSKVRAISRIAVKENEEMLLDWARQGTASQVEKLVRCFRKANREEENDNALAQQRRRELITYYDDDGMLVIRGRLPAAEGALVMKALDTCTKELQQAQNVSAETCADAKACPEPEHLDGDQRQADALVRVAERALADAAGNTPTADRYQVVVHVDQEVLADPDADGRCELQDGPSLAADTARRLACDCSVCELSHGPDGELVVGRKTRAVSTTLRRALLARDGTRCTFPGCNCRSVDAHHAEHWANGGRTVAENLTLLCAYHHLLVHEGGYHVEALSGGRFRFLRPDGQEVLAAPALPTVRGDVVEVLSERYLGPDVQITPETGRATWDGEPVDYDWSLIILHQSTPSEPAEQTDTTDT